MNLQTVIAQNGPLPVSASFNAESDAEMVLVVSGSAWSNAAGQWVGVQILLDDNIVGEAAVFCNEAGSHRALITTLLPATVAFGQHTISLEAVNTYTQCDANDFLNAYLMY